MDEEDKYGAVIREANTNVYVPPALRKQQQQQSQSQQKPQQQKSSEQPANFSNLPPDSPLHKLTTGTLNKTSVNPSALRNEMNKSLVNIKIKIKKKKWKKEKDEKNEKEEEEIKEFIKSPFFYKLFLTLYLF